MKKSVVILTVCICLGTTGCGTNAKTDAASATTQKKTEAVTTEAVTTDEAMTEETETMAQEETSSIQVDEGQAAEYMASIDMVDYSRDVEAEDGTLLLKVTQNCPDITIDGSAAAADNMNDSYLKEKEAFDAMIEKYAKAVKADYKELSEEDKNNYQEYISGLEEGGQIEADFKLEYSLKRADEQCISIVKDSYENTDEYPNSFREAAVFDTATGEQLTFEGIFEDTDEARAFITDYLSKILRKKYKDVLYDDYEKSITDILDRNTWYLSKGGFVIICNESVITPYAAGCTEFTIPYSKLDGLGYLYQ